MSRFRLTFQQLNVLKAEIGRKVVDLRAQISAIDTVPEVELIHRNPYRGKWTGGTFFGGSVRKLYILYRFFTAKARLVIKRKAKMASAPAKELEAARVIKAHKEAPLVSKTPKEMTVNSAFRTSVSARLIAYYRAPFVFIRKICTAHTVKMKTVKGAVAKYLKKTKLQHISQMETADSAILESKNSVVCEVKAAGSSAPPMIAAVDNKFIAKSKASASAAGIMSANIQSVEKVKHHARLFAWFAYEQEGDTLTMYQVFSGVQSGDALEVDLEEESVYWANAFVIDDTMYLIFAETTTQNNNILEVN